MPGIIDSAPECIQDVDGAVPADDSADFIVGAAYEECAGFMTFGPGTTYGEEGVAATAAYYLTTWMGIAFLLAALAIWVLYERARLRGHVERLTHWTNGERLRDVPDPGGPAAGGPGLPEEPRRPGGAHQP